MARQSNRLGAGVWGLALGASLMYVLDPARGRSRRARLRDKLTRAEHELAGAGRVAAHDLVNRAHGVAHDLATVARPDPADDEIIAARVRSRLGRAIAHPGGVEVDCARRVITLKGPVLRDEVDELVRKVRHVRGVHDVVNQLAVHDEPGAVQALQGERRRGRTRMSPSTKLLAAVGAGALLGASALLR